MYLKIFAGIVVYSLVSIVYWQKFSGLMFFSTIIFSILPDIDYIPYFITFRRKKLVSHYFIHYPLLYLGVVALIGLNLRNWYLFALFLFAPSIHFLIDTISTPHGILWLYPFSKTGFYLKRVSWDEKMDFFQRARERRERENPEWDPLIEFKERFDPRKLTSKKLALLATASLLAIIIHILLV